MRLRAARLTFEVMYIFAAGALLLPAAPAQSKLDDLLERARRSPADALEAVVEARSAPPKVRADFARRVGGTLSAADLSATIARLQALKEPAADRWTLELIHFLPQGHELRLRGPAMLAQLWREGAALRLIQSLSPSPGNPGLDLLGTLLATLRHSSKTPALADRLWKLALRKDAPGEIRALALGALVGFEEKGFHAKVLKRHAVEEDPEVRAALIDLLAEEGSTESLAAIVKSHEPPARPTSRERSALIRYAARVGGDAGLSVVRDTAIYARDPAERILAIECLGAFAGHPRFLETVREVRQLRLNEPDVRLRMTKALLEMLAASSDAAAAGMIEEALGEADADLRLSATYLLRGFPPEGAIPLQAKLLSDPDSRVVCGALWGLFATRKGAALDAILRGLESLSKRGGLPYRDAIRILVMATGKDFGSDPAAWSAWRARVEELPDGFGAAASGRKGRTAVRGFFQHRIYSHHPLFVLDISGSMDRTEGFFTRIEILYRELEAALESVDETVQFCIIAFDDDVHPWPKGPQPATGGNVRDAIGFLKSIPRRGGTNYHAALDAVVRSVDFDTVYFLSDGLPTKGEIRDAPGITQWFKEMNGGRALVVNTIGIGDSGDLLRRLALENRGTYTAMGGHGG